VAYTAVVYAYNMLHQCTVYVPVYTLYVHVYARYIHVLTRCFNMMGRVQLMPLFLAGNSTPSIPHKYRQHKRSGFPVGTCDTAAADGRRGSNMYEVNQWLWQFGHGKLHLGGLSVEKTDDRKEATLKEQSLRRAETSQHSKADLA
jgi:hypothetical protein